MKIIDCEQGSEQWFEAKRGVPSASNFDKIVLANGKPSKQRTKYLYRLAGEIVTGVQEESYQNEAMLRGKELETEARQFYQITSGNEALQVGFCMLDGYGCSPDGFIGNEGLLEIKCPIMATHIGYLLANTLPVEYFQQCQGQLLVTGRKWLDFVSYYPGLKPLVVRVKPDNEFLNTLITELAIFCDELKDIVEKIR